MLCINAGNRENVPESGSCHKFLECFPMPFICCNRTFDDWTLSALAFAMQGEIFFFLCTIHRTSSGSRRQNVNQVKCWWKTLTKHGYFWNCESRITYHCMTLSSAPEFVCNSIDARTLRWPCPKQNKKTTTVLAGVRMREGCETGSKQDRMD